ncbi:MAG: hypothetical protein AAGK97_08055, partial [Bacteroidota bacterium]
QGSLMDTLFMNGNNSLGNDGKFFSSANMDIGGDIALLGDTLNQTAPGSVTTRSSFTIGEDAVYQMTGFTNIEKDFINYGGVLNEYGFLSIFNFTGEEESVIEGIESLRFLFIDKDEPDDLTKLGSDLAITGSLSMKRGNIDLNGHVLDMKDFLIFSESDTSYITSNETSTLNSGYVKSSGNHNVLNTRNLGIQINTNEELGEVEVRRYPTTHHDISGQTRMTRMYTVTPSNVSEPIADAEIVINYFDHELNGNNETMISPYVILTGEQIVPVPEQIVLNQDTLNNQLLYKGLYPENTILLASADRSINWTGVEDEDWFNSNNWDMKGTPNYLYDVIIPNTSHDPIIDSIELIARAKNLELKASVNMEVVTELKLNNVGEEDICELAVEIFCGQTYVGNTMQATNSDFIRGNDRWFYLAPMDAGTEIILSLCNSQYDTYLAVYDDCTLSNLVSENDNNIPDCNSSKSQLQFVSSGSEYYVKVDGSSLIDAGEFELEVSCIPVNDVCEGAIDVACGDTKEFDTSSATIIDQPEGCVLSMSDSPGIWYKYTRSSLNNQYVTVSLCGTSFDTQLYLYTGSCANLTCIDANEDNYFCTQNVYSSELAFSESSLTGEIYFYITGFGDDSGEGEISINCLQEQPIFDCEPSSSIAYGGEINPPFELDSVNTFTPDCATSQNLVPVDINQVGIIGVDKKIKNVEISIS